MSTSTVPLHAPGVPADAQRVAAARRLLGEVAGPAAFDRLSRVAAGIYRLEGQLMVVLDVDRVLDIRNGAVAA